MENKGGKRMTFLEAKTALKELAKGEYHSISYEISEYSSGGLEIKCTMYVHGYRHTTDCKTWEDALFNMRQQMGIYDPIGDVRRVLEQMPS